MPTIRSLLDCYGPPPPEIALDWSWQIAQRCALNAGASEIDSHCLLTERSWTDLEVAEDGQLVCDQLEPRVARAALLDLRHWAGRASIEQFTPAAPGNLTEAVQVADVRQTGANATISALPSARKRADTPSRSHFIMRTWTGRALVGIAAAAILVAAIAIVMNSSSSAQPMSEIAKGDAASATLDAEHAQRDAVSDSIELDTSRFGQLQADIPIDPLASSLSSPSLGQLDVAASLQPNANLEPSDQTHIATDVDLGHAEKSEGDKQAGAVVLDEVAKALQAAEAEEALDVAKHNVDGNNLADDSETQSNPWVLTRNTMRYVVNVSPKLNINARQSQWTLTPEPIAGLAIGPAGPQVVSGQAFALWRIYDADAKPPRACLYVRARQLGRECKLELVFCGGSEDLPTTSIPLAERWLGPLTVLMQTQAIELRGGLNRLANTVITPGQVNAAWQRKQAMIAQMQMCARLSNLMPEINRLAELADGQVTLHAALKPKPDEPPVATWGTIEVGSRQ